MNKENIPKELHFLIPIAEEWGIGDDAYIDEKVERSSNEDLNILVEYFTNDTAISFNNWLENPNSTEPQTEEYYIFTSLLMALEYAQAELSNRIK